MSNVNNSKLYLPDSEKIEFLTFFSEKEALFQTLVSMGKIILTDGPYPTAWVTFDKEGQYLNFYFNEVFWNKLTFYERAFIIGHECLHVLLYHGIRINSAEQKDVANIAADLVVNHLLLSKFGFNRAELPIASSACLRDTVFSKKEKLPAESEATYEKYYDCLLKHIESIKEACASIDEHNPENESGAGSTAVEDSKTDDKQKEEEQEMNSEISSGEMTEDDITDLITKSLGESELKDIKEFVKKIESDLPAENTYGPNPFSAHTTDASKWKTKQNLSWKKIFLKVARNAMKISEKENFQWIRKSRRNNLLPENLFLPHSIDIEELKQDKLSVQLYIDFSGSCRNLQKDFWLAYDSIPKKLFSIDLYTYSDVIHPVDKKTKQMQGTWGNAPFQIIENNIKSQIKQNKLKKYPDCVVVFTDGHADGVKPEKPENWIWILPKNGSTTSYLPKESKKHWLEDIVK